MLPNHNGQLLTNSEVCLGDNHHTIPPKPSSTAITASAIAPWQRSELLKFHFGPTSSPGFGGSAFRAELPSFFSGSFLAVPKWCIATLGERHRSQRFETWIPNAVFVRKEMGTGREMEGREHCHGTVAEKKANCLLGEMTAKALKIL